MKENVYSAALWGAITLLLCGCSQSSDWYERTVDMRESRDMQADELMRHGYEEEEARARIWLEEMKFNTETGGRDDVVRDPL